MYEVLNKNHMKLQAAIVEDKTGDGFVYQILLVELNERKSRLSLLNLALFG